ncbi:MAG: Carbon-nitrogen hydrolase [candidate division WS6 bacterium GW2011_GWA2_37_6]|uniref:Carbon-nitrogen hydrolase n=1 Tax=candidate division WS6 bacterium GW2011_GWA2_37_6 TaxID=1619087 RepID=A0A0G0GTN0_9BACT|nr:MAG: Carbon-nitrogen hydrolase [candidate division WS6 bacterium GW2011_GWA2_37_6]
MHKLKIAISQFPVSENIQRNEAYITKHIIKAAKSRADVIHFPETALTGYEATAQSLDWTLLAQSLERIKLLAKKFKIYIVLGLHHRTSTNLKPFDCTYLISKNGEIEGKYFKANLYKNEKDRFSAKSNFLIKSINGVKCGFLICYDSCFPELFQHYRQKGVKIIFLSYYNAKSTHDKNSMDELMRAQFITRATDNLMYISGSNSSAKYSRMPSSIVSPDGKITSLKRHKPGVLFYDYPAKTLGWTFNNSSKK